MSEVRTLRLDDAIGFAESVDCALYSKLITLASKHLAADDTRCNVTTMEGLRRATALIEAILTRKVVLDEIGPDKWGQATNDQ